MRPRTLCDGPLSGAAAATTLLAIACLGCAGGDPGAQPTRGGGARHLLVITLDTARADRFVGDAAAQVETPVIDRLAAEGTTFRDAVTVAPLTLVAHASLFTGQLPIAHGVRNNGTFRLADEATTLAEMMRARGFRTGAAIGAAVLERRYGLDQGFDFYDDRLVDGAKAGAGFFVERRADAVVAAAGAWLRDDDDRPSFLWVHLFDPHAPYAPPEPERSRYAEAPYDGEIAYADRMLGRLLEVYRELGLYDDTMVVFTSDHGESLGEHGELSHGIFIYDATMRVPLVIRVPGRGQGRAIDQQVSLVDVLPTIAEVFDLEPLEEVHGRDLGPAIDGEPLGQVPAYVESLLPRLNHGWSEMRGVRSDGWKLILGAEPELYDLRSDPNELDDRSRAEIERATELGQVLELDFGDRVGDADERIEVDEQTRRQLAALGYFSLQASEPEPTSSRLPDPRAQIWIAAAEARSLQLFELGFRHDAIGRHRALAERDPGNHWVELSLVRMLMASGRADEALAAVERPCAAGSAKAWAYHGRLLEALGRPEEARSSYDRALDIDATTALAAWRLRALDGTSKPAPANGTVDEAALRRAVAADPDDPAAQSALGEHLLEGGQPLLAFPHLQRAQEVASSDLGHALALARALLQLGRPGEVRKLFTNVAPATEVSTETWATIGEACRRLGDRPCEARASIRAASLAGRAEDGRARVLGELTDTSTARTELDRADRLLTAGAATSARAAIEPRYRAGPLDPHVILAFAEACARESDVNGLTEALTLFSELYLDPEDELDHEALLARSEERDLRPLAARLSRVGNAAWDARSYVDAMHAFRLGALLVPDHAGLRYNLGLAWERLGSPEDALAAFEQAVARDPQLTRAERHREFVAEVVARLASSRSGADESR